MQRRFFLLALVASMSLPAVVQAQTNVQPLPDWLAPQAAEAPEGGSSNFGPGVPPPPPPPPPPVPIDGGLSLLALAGAGYAAKRLRSRRS